MIRFIDDFFCIVSSVEKISSGTEWNWGKEPNIKSTQICYSM